MKTAVVTDGDAGRVDEADAATASKQAVPLGTSPSQDTRHELDEASLTDLVGNLAPQIHDNLLRIVGFAVPLLTLVAVDEHRHQFAVAQFTRACSMDLSPRRCRFHSNSVC